MFISYAQNFEDVMLWRALKGVGGGFYVDVGAQDPVVDSVSLAFYQHGWRGVHIEPVPAYANRLREQRPDEVVIQALVGAASGVTPFFEVPETGLSTTNRDTAVRHREAGFVVRETLVPCVPLAEALAAFLGREIHWLKIDVEGSERQVIQGWGSELKPWVVVIESTVPLSQIESHQLWEPLIVSLGYNFAYFDGLNRFFVSSEHPELLEAFRYGPTIFDGFSLSGSSTSPFCSSLNAELDALRGHNRVVQEELEGQEHRTREVLRTLTDQGTKLTASLARVEALEGDVVQWRGQVNTLHESVSIVRRYAANVEVRLVEAHDRIKILDENLTNAESRLGMVAQELIASQGRSLQLETAGNAAKAELLDLQRQSDHWRTLAERWHADLQALHRSRSLRLTAPLRGAGVFGKTAARLIRLGLTTIVQLPRRLLRGTLLACLAYVDRRPKVKAQVARLLGGLPSILDTLTTFAWAHRNRAVISSSARDKNSGASDRPEDDVQWELYPASVRDTYRQLMEARGNTYAQTTTD